MKIYDPIGIYKAKEESKKLKGDFGVILPVELTLKAKPYKIPKATAIDISNGGHNGIFVAIRVENDKNEEVEHFPNPNYLTVNEVKFDMEIENYDISVWKTHVIIYHDNNFNRDSDAEVINLAKEFVRENDYESSSRFRYPKGPEQEIVQPETAGGGILVGTGG